MLHVHYLLTHLYWLPIQTLSYCAASIPLCCLRRCLGQPHHCTGRMAEEAPHSLLQPQLAFKPGRAVLLNDTALLKILLLLLQRLLLLLIVVLLQVLLVLRLHVLLLLVLMSLLLVVVV